VHLINTVIKQKQYPNPLLDVSMSYFQTNTHLENLEVVERADIILTTIGFGAENRMASYMSPNFQLSINFL